MAGLELTTSVLLVWCSTTDQTAIPYNYIYRKVLYTRHSGLLNDPDGENVILLNPLKTRPLFAHVVVSQILPIKLDMRERPGQQMWRFGKIPISLDL